MFLLLAIGALTEPEPVEFDCDKAVVVGMPPGTCWDRFGRNVEAIEGPVVAGKPTVQVLHQPEWGTGYFKDAVMLLARESERYRVLWSHVLIELDSGQPGSDPDIAEAKSYKWTLDPAGQRIAVTGISMSGDITDVYEEQVVGERRVLPPEYYCYSSAARRFERCNP